MICKKFGVRGTTRIEGITSEKERVRNLADGVADQLRNNAAPIIMRKGNHPKGTTPAMRVNENKERLRLKQINPSTANFMSCVSWNPKGQSVYPDKCQGGSFILI